MSTLSPDQYQLLAMLQSGPILPVTPMPGQPDYLDQFARMGFVIMCGQSVHITDAGRQAVREWSR